MGMEWIEERLPMWLCDETERKKGREKQIECERERKFSLQSNFESFEPRGHYSTTLEILFRDYAGDRGRILNEFGAPLVTKRWQSPFRGPELVSTFKLGLRMHKRRDCKKMLKLFFYGNILQNWYQFMNVKTIYYVCKESRYKKLS